MKKIGLTGGIGSGKSTVAEIFSQLGVPVFNSDNVARKLQDEDEEVRNATKKIFGNDTYDDKGKLIRKKLAEIVFSDKNKLKELNSIVHPAVAKAFDKFCEQNISSAFVLKESAILFEIGDDKNLDGMILVTAPVDVRVERVMKRDEIPKEDVLKRMKNQWSEEFNIQHSTFNIVNDGKNLILPEVIAINKKLSSQK